MQIAMSSQSEPGHKPPPQVGLLNTKISPLAPPLPLPFPSSIGLVSRKEVVDLDLIVLRGSIPTDLHGHAFFVGPAGSFDSPPCGETGLIHPSADGTPLFNGDPLVHRVDFIDHDETGNINVKLTSKIPRTPCYYTDQACATDPRWRELCYDNFGLARLSFTLGFRNEVNTAVIPLHFNEREGNRLLLTWDAGRPFEIDPVSLEIATAVGYDVEWKELIELKVPFGIFNTPAHSAYSPRSQIDRNDAKLFTLNFGKSIATFLHPILFGYVDAPLASDKELEKTIQGLIFFSESLLNSVVSGLRILRWIEKLFPPTIVGGLKRGLLSLLRVGRGLLKPYQPVENELTKPSVLNQFAILVEEQLTGELAPAQNSDTKSIDDTLIELLRLIGVLKDLLLAPSQMEDFVHLMSWDGQNQLQRWKVFVDDGSAESQTPPKIMQSMHQIGVTKDYIILMDTVFKLGLEQLLTAPAPDFPKLERMIRKLFDYRQSDKTIIYIISRSHLSPDKEFVKAKRIEIPRGTAHFLVDYENPFHQITLHCVHNTGWDAAEWVRPYDQNCVNDFSPSVGMATCSTDVNIMARYVIDGVKGIVQETRLSTQADPDLCWMLALYSICQPDGVRPPEKIKKIFWNGWGSHGDLLTKYVRDLNKAAQPRIVSMDQAAQVARHGLPGTLLRLDTASMTIADRYVFPAGRFGNSVQFIPKPGAVPGDDSGYLMCVVNGSDDPIHSEFWLFDAQNLAAGPICCLGHPSLKIGLTIHSTWLPKIMPRCANYMVSVRKDYSDRLDRIGSQKELSPLFETYVYPHFDPHG